MSILQQHLQESVRAIRERTKVKARVGIVLGTGLGALGKEVQAELRMPFSQIPHMASASVQSHSGELVAGTLNGTPVYVLEGRLHYYEGHRLSDIVYPVRLLHALGCEVLVLSNAAGGLNAAWALGDLMVIEDHINLPGLVGANPLVGPNDEAVGPRFPDMSRPYDRKLIESAHAAAKATGLSLREGVYVMVTGPNLETRAEYRMLRNLGADVVGMSTLPEVVAARHVGMRVVAFSIVTDLCIPETLEEADIDTIIKTASAAEPKLTKLVKQMVGTLA
ncbi:MAG: purine-nucleoside phosphorylase [Planctomycetes bacterium]|nr:purine-nucleoside phosphorylase [Planctomycetota bacterium]